MLAIQITKTWEVILNRVLESFHFKSHTALLSLLLLPTPSPPQRSILSFCYSERPVVYLRQLFFCF